MANPSIVQTYPKGTLAWWLNLIITILTAALTVIGTSALTSCESASAFRKSNGITRVYTTDTTIVKHGGDLQIKIK